MVVYVLWLALSYDDAVADLKTLPLCSPECVACLLADTNFFLVDADAAVHRCNCHRYSIISGVQKGTILSRNPDDLVCIVSTRFCSHSLTSSWSSSLGLRTSLGGTKLRRGSFSFIYGMRVVAGFGIDD